MRSPRIFIRYAETSKLNWKKSIFRERAALVQRLKTNIMSIHSTMSQTLMVHDSGQILDNRWWYCNDGPDFPAYEFIIGYKSFKHMYGRLPNE